MAPLVLGTLILAIGKLAVGILARILARWAGNHAARHALRAARQLRADARVAGAPVQGRVLILAIHSAQAAVLALVQVAQAGAGHYGSGALLGVLVVLEAGLLLVMDRAFDLAIGTELQNLPVVFARERIFVAASQIARAIGLFELFDGVGIALKLGVVALDAHLVLLAPIEERLFFGALGLKHGTR